MDNLKLIEKYKVKDFETLQIPKRIKSILTQNIDSYYRYIFYSTPGTGKTTTAKLLAKSKNLEIKYLSGSNEFKAETMRKIIYPFCNNYALGGKEKILIIDEAENISNKIQDAFKIILDSAKKIRFIFITNEIEKMNDAVQSRCTKINYNYTAQEVEEQKGIYLKYFINIAQKENIKFSKEGLMEFLKYNFPDFRAGFDMLELFKMTNKAITVDNINSNKVISGMQIPEIYDLIENPSKYDPRKFYEIISKYKGIEQQTLLALGEPYFQWLNAKGKWELTLETAQVVNRYFSDYEKTINKFGLLVSCVYELRKLNI